MRSDIATHATLAGIICVHRPCFPSRFRKRVMNALQLSKQKAYPIHHLISKYFFEEGLTLVRHATFYAARVLGHRIGTFVSRATGNMCGNLFPDIGFGTPRSSAARRVLPKKLSARPYITLGRSTCQIGNQHSGRVHSISLVTSL